jgi:hypothetical protein
VAAGKCNLSNSALVLCVDFEDKLMPAGTADITPIAHNDTVAHTPDASTVALQPVPRASESAASLGTGASITVPAANAFDLGTQPFTLEMWVYATSLPSGEVSLIRKADQQYAMTIDTSGEVLCYLGSNHVGDSSRLVSANSWTHVACTYDGSTLRTFVNGSPTQCVGTSQVNGSAAAIRIASDGFAGAVDNVRVYNTQLHGTSGSPSLCSLANQSNCSSCPGGGSGDD